MTTLHPMTHPTILSSNVSISVKFLDTITKKPLLNAVVCVPCGHVFNEETVNNHGAHRGCQDPNCRKRICPEPSCRKNLTMVLLNQQMRDAVAEHMAVVANTTHVPTEDSGHMDANEDASTIGHEDTCVKVEMSKEHYCVEHGKEKNFFCELDEVLGCSSCFAKDGKHSRHAFIDLTSMTTKQSASIRSNYMSQLTEMERRIVALSQKCDALNAYQAEWRASSPKEQVANIVGPLQRQIEVFEAMWVNKAEELHAALAPNTGLSQELGPRLHAWVESIHEAKEFSNSQLLACVKDLLQKGEELSKRATPIASVSVPQFNMSKSKEAEFASLLGNIFSLEQEEEKASSLASDLRSTGTAFIYDQMKGEIEYDGPQENAFRLRMFHSLAVQFASKKQYEVAVPLCVKGIEEIRKALGPDHVDLAVMLNILALIYRDQGNFGAAEVLLLEALHIREKSLGADNSAVAAVLNNLSIVYGKQGKFKEARAASERALAIREKAFGPSHPDVAKQLNNLALLLQNMGNFYDAEANFERALSIYQKTMGNDDINTRKTRNNLVACFLKQGKEEEAEALQQQVTGPKYEFNC